MGAQVFIEALDVHEYEFFYDEENNERGIIIYDVNMYNDIYQNIKNQLNYYKKYISCLL